LVLPTRVNIINDSSERIKVKIDNDRDRKFDEIINIKPGSRLDDIEGSVWGWGKFDVIVDIITNPDGPDNNTRLGGFKFENPFTAEAYVESDDFTTLTNVCIKEPFCLSRSKTRTSGYLKKRYWGKLDIDLLDKEEDLFVNIALLVNSAPKPTFTVESFFNDSEAGAKVWDLRINSDNFTL
jgi:hypothetical protein